ncbi:QSOX1 [Symbiodinium natans]|uniref:QSOX1 protein n=1 Tax=Symbiodinium natans TaxID=878477 RepID=A0A812UQE4_9DINO|nr:QSOX1 [Symbiodinium natans]
MDVTPKKEMDPHGQGDSEASTSYNSSPGATTQAEETFGVDSTGPQRSTEAVLQEAMQVSGPKDSATKVILNLRSIVEKNGGQLGLPRLVSREMQRVDENGEAVPKPWDPFREAERLRAELANARSELQRVQQAIVEESDLRLQQAMLQSKVQEVEQREAVMHRRALEFEERAKRDHEVSSLQCHIFEVEMKRCQEELQQSRSKIEALERELKQAQKSKQRKAEGCAKTSAPSSQEAVRRHEIAVRASFEECREKTSPSKRSSNEDAQGWLACCSVQAAPKKRV